jgi:flagellar basal-body rod modification protein FlgD
MSISSILGSSNNNITQNNNISPKNSILSQYDFLNLLTAQMRYQNPLNPMDYYQISSMLTQLGSLEALNNIGRNLESSILYQASANYLQSANLIGKKIKSLGNFISIENGSVSEIYYQLTKPGRVNVQIFDLNGNLVTVLNEGYKHPSEHKFNWNGKDTSGKPVEDGIYLFRVLAFDESGKPLPVNSYQTDRVKGVSFENGTIYLAQKSGKIKINDVISIME